MTEKRDKQCLALWDGRRLLVPGILALLALAIIPLAETFFRPVKLLLGWLPLSSFFSTAGQWGGATTSYVIILVIWCLDLTNRHRLIYFIVALLLAGSMNGVIKQTTGRIRPQHSVGLNKKEVAKRAAEKNLTPEQSELLKTDRWLWWSKERIFFHDDHASFPSGHACSAFVAAAFLCALYPRGRYLWLIGAVGAGLARIKFERHYLEDVLFGGAIGWIVALWVFSWCWPLVFGKKIEAAITRQKPV